MMSMRALIAVLLSAATLAGCVSVDPRQQRADDERTCRSYGFKPGTNAYAECLQRIDLSRDDDRRARLYGNRGGWGGGIGYGVGPYGGFGGYW
jgi:hypothetical protein